MTMAAAIDSRTAPAPVRSQAERIARVDILSDLAAAEPIWRALEVSGQFCTPYQRFDLLAAWQRHAGAREGAKPFIVTAVDAEQRPLLVLPLTLKRRHGVRVAHFMGGKHTTFNMGLWDREFAATATAVDLDRLLAGLREQAAADVLALTQQPVCWHGPNNPLALWPHQASVNDCPLLVMPPSAEPTALMSNSFRRRLKSKEKKLQALPGYRYQVAVEDAEITRAARLVLPGQAVADGGAEAAERVRRARRRGVRARGLPEQAAFGRSRHRHPRARLRRGGDRAVRRRRRRPALLDDVQHLHAVGERALEPRA